MNALKLILVSTSCHWLHWALTRPRSATASTISIGRSAPGKTHLKRLQHPLTGSTTWVEYEGTTVVRKVWDGRANMVELDVKGSAGAIEALSLRLYNPESRQWSLNFAKSTRGGTMTLPAIGEFKNGRGEFYNQDTLNGRSIFVKFIIQCQTADICKFEQSFSGDGGKTWEAQLDRDGYESQRVRAKA